MLQVVDDSTTNTLADPHASLLYPPTTEQRLPPPESSRPPTPDHDQLLFDEPSSALASRIMHAQDNPSPPPSSPLSQYRLIDISEPATPSHAAPGLPESAILMPFSPFFGPSSAYSPNSDLPQGDLITFDANDKPTTNLEPGPFVNDSNLTPSKSPEPSSTDGNPRVVNRSSPQLMSTEEDPFMHPSDSKESGQKSDIQITPIRRSARMRRSIASQPTYMAQRSFDSLDSPTRVVSQSGSKTRIRRKSAKSPSMLDSPVWKSPGHVGNQYSEVHGVEVEVDNQHADAPSACLRLDSLSPTSSHVLSQLITTSLNEESSKPPVMDTMQQPSTSSVDAARTPLKNSTLVGTPRRIILDQSPSKSLPPDQLRTPARRILVEEAPRSAQTFLRMATTGSALNFGLLQTPMLPMPSPARRVLISETATNNSNDLKYDVMPSHSSVRQVEIRGLSEELVNSGDPLRLIKGRSGSVGPPSMGQPVKRSATAISSSRPRKLPFPLIPEPIPEESETKGHAYSTTSSTPIIHSGLKQPTSRIPRIGGKPYARPATTTATTVNKSHGFARSVQPTKPTSGAGTSQPKPPARSQVVPDRIGTHKSLTLPPAHSVDQSTMAPKRKRSPEDTQSPSKTSRVLSRPTHRPVVSQTAKAMNRVSAKVLDALTPDVAQMPHQDVCTNSSTSQQTSELGTIAPSSHLPPCSVVGIIHNKQDTKHMAASVVEPTRVPDVSASVASSAPEEQSSSGVSIIAPVTGQVPLTEHHVAETAEPNSTELHRTTRSQKKMQSTTPRDASRSSQSRKKVSNSRTSDPTDTLSGMSAVALKALTNSNTTKNQQYVAAKIQTEVIRKSGFRPTSPTVKTQTVLQRIQDEKSRERHERAQRRAQRSEGATGDDQYTDTPCRSESPMSAVLLPNVTDGARSTGSSSGHRRGAGEEEDYQSPERPPKKTAIYIGLEPGEIKTARRVKWDKGLFTEVHLNEIHLGVRRLQKNTTVAKGCLAPTSKVLSLDTMGNMPNASVPVEDLVEECIIVKKYVYDDDEEFAPPIAQGTRSKAKKSKT